jgi:hypothetical protein
LPALDFAVKCGRSRVAFFARWESGGLAVIEAKQAAKALEVDNFLAGVLNSLVRKRNDVVEPLVVAFGVVM